MAKTAPKKVRALSRFQKFVLSKSALYLYKSSILLTCNVVVMPGLVLLVFTLICWKSYRNVCRDVSSVLEQVEF